MLCKPIVEKADQAAENSLNSTSNLKIKLKQKIESLNQLVSDINELFTYISSDLLKHETVSPKGKMCLKRLK